jgi:hypothetical protein
VTCVAVPGLRSSIPGIHDVDSDLQDSSDYEQRVATSMNLNSLLKHEDNGCASEQTTEVDPTPYATP